MKNLILALATVLLMTACGRSSSSTVETPSEIGPTDTIELASNPHLNSSNPMEVLAELNRIKNDYEMMVAGNSISSVEDLVTKKILSELPKPPAGRQYDYDAKKNLIVLK